MAADALAYMREKQVHRPESLHLPYDGELRLLNIDTSNDRVLLNEPHSQRDQELPLRIMSLLNWSANGQNLIFVGVLRDWQTGTLGPYELSAETSDYRRLSIWHGHDPSHVRDICMSPNGDYLAYTLVDSVKEFIPETPRHIVIYDMRKEKLITIAESSRDYFGLVNWSPDGRKLIYKSRTGAKRHLFDVETETSSQITITHGDAATMGISLDGMCVASPRWSNTGRVLFYMLIGNPPISARQVVKLNIQTGDKQYIPGPKGDAPLRVAPAPNNSRIAIQTVKTDSLHNITHNQVHIVDDEIEKLVFSTTNKVLVQNLSWSSSDQYLLLELKIMGRSPELLIIDATTGEEIHRVEGQHAAWRP